MPEAESALAGGPARAPAAASTPQAAAASAALPQAPNPSELGEAQSFGAYRLVERLGSGGMAEVFRAVRPMMGGRLEKVVAIKRILPCFTDDREFVELLVDEARLTMRLSHPNVAQTLEIDAIDGVVYLAMEYVDGPSLAEVLRRQASIGARLPLEVSLYIAIEAAAALHAAHTLCDASGRSLEVIHRDVSPHNILLDRGGAVKVIDFGVARARDRLVQTRDGAMRGKLSYFSPERAAGRAFDARSDLFSLGLVLWTMLTGRHPLHGRSHMQSLLELEQWQAPDLAEHLAGAPPELYAVVGQLLARDPAARQPDAETLRAELAAILYGRAPAFSPLCLASIIGPRAAPEPSGVEDAVSGEAAAVEAALPMSERPTMLHEGLSAQLAAASRGLRRAPAIRRRTVMAIAERPTMLKMRAVVTGAWRVAHEGPVRTRAWLYVTIAIAAVSALLGGLVWTRLVRERGPAAAPEAVAPVAAATSAEEASAQLELDSTPRGAEILLGGKPTGSVTPAVLDLPAGPTELRLRRESYSDKLVAVDLVAGRRKVMTLDLERAPAIVELHVVPSTTARVELPGLDKRYLVYKGEPVFVDGLRVGEPVTVVVHADGQPPVERRVVPASTLDTVVLDLARQPSDSPTRPR